ncbi:hypothetical protein [Tistrella mobilis]|uniref:Uncharacterized protein n=1 Tax=Tistrella mobilis (strain KA081020-065) TaxID=1110502 RepID=I3TR26_TISMK|nr:hypothetical protein [Tistrella mobilis]AFK55214.1 hypothetical protein TMO_3376 [Tistrella mobilis KA081020-065]
MDSIEAAADAVLRNAPQFSSVETATIVMTAATIVLGAVALFGATYITRKAARQAEMVAEKGLGSAVRAYLDGPEFQARMAALIDRGIAGVASANVVAAEEQRPGAPGPQETTSDD